jgi:hypothetical protein
MKQLYRFHHNWHLSIKKHYGRLTYLQDPLTLNTKDRTFVETVTEQLPT